MKVCGVGYVMIESIKFICGGNCIKRERTGINISGLDSYRRRPIIIINASSSP
jgi:hypothetical protein